EDRRNGIERRAKAESCTSAIRCRTRRSCVRCATRYVRRGEQNDVRAEGSIRIREISMAFQRRCGYEGLGESLTEVSDIPPLPAPGRALSSHWWTECGE